MKKLESHENKNTLNPHPNGIQRNNVYETSVKNINTNIPTGCKKNGGYGINVKNLDTRIPTGCNKIDRL